MNKVDWKHKLTSRKFWVAIAGFISLTLTALHVQPGTVQQISAIMMAGATVVAYIVGEGLVDAATVSTTTTPEQDAAAK